MSFSRFSNVSCNFTRLDTKLNDLVLQENYYNRWMQKYAQVFKTSSPDLIGIEWDLRCRKSLREIFSSATFLIEAKKNLEMGCFSSYYFCLYYSLFHAIYSSLFLDADSAINKLFDITHRNIINKFISAFGNTKSDIMEKDIGALFQDLRYRREYYSYITPLNNLFDYQKDLDTLVPVLLDCYQLTSLHSLLIQKSYSKNVGKIIHLSTTQEYDLLNDLFFKLFSKADPSGNLTLDPSCENIHHELLQYGFSPEYIVSDLDHQFDEFHTYDQFYGNNYPENSLKIADIWTFTSEALI